MSGRLLSHTGPLSVTFMTKHLFPSTEQYWEPRWLITLAFLETLLGVVWFRWPRMEEACVDKVIRCSHELSRWFEEGFWDLKLSPGLMLLTFMNTHLFQFCY